MHRPPLIQPTECARPVTRTRDAVRRTRSKLAKPTNQDAIVFSHYIVRSVLYAQARQVVPWQDWRALHGRLFGDLGWPALINLRVAWLAKGARLPAQDHLEEHRRLPGRALRVLLLGWPPPGATRAQLARQARGYHRGDRARNPFRGWYKRLSDNDHLRRELEQRIRAEGVAIDWTPQGPQFHALEIKADMRDTA